MAEPFPPCVTVVVFDKRVVYMADKTKCDEKHNTSKRYFLKWGTFNEWVPNPYHPGFLTACTTRVNDLQTDDLDQALTTFEKAETWVKNG